MRTLVLRIFSTVFFSFFIFTQGFSGDPGLQSGEWTRGTHIAVICPSSFRAALNPWIQHRSDQGYTIHLLEPNRETTIADIRSAIRDAAEKHPLGYVLLVGDVYSSDPSVQTVPSPRVDSRVIQFFGEEDHIASDNLFGDLDDDGLPELAVGRFSVESSRDLECIVEKILRYESSLQIGPWLRDIHLIAGVGGFSPVLDRTIDSSARYILSRMIPPEYRISLIQADWKSPYCPAPWDFKKETIRRMNEGPLFWVYMGHGQPRELDFLRLPNEEYFPIFEENDVSKVQCRNGLPIVFLMACFSGALDTVEPCLAEELHRLENGPVAVFASSRTSMPYGMSVFGIGLIEETFHSRERSESPLLLGDVFLAAKRKMIFGERVSQRGFSEKRSEGPLRSPRSQSRDRSVRDMIDSVARTMDPTGGRLQDQRWDHVHLFQLFGDPLLRIPQPLQVNFTAPDSAKPATTIPIWGSSPGKGVLSIELAIPSIRNTVANPQRNANSLDENALREFNRTYQQANRRVLAEKTLSVEKGRFSTEFSLPEIPRGEYDLRIFWKSEQQFGLESRRILLK